MSKVEELTIRATKPTEFEAFAGAGLTVLDAIPGAVYICDSEGKLVSYNSEAAKLWGRLPRLGAVEDRFCGSHRLFTIDGLPLAHSDCPMAEAVRNGLSTRNKEVLIERPDGSRIVAIVNVRALKDHRGTIEGAINCFQNITDRKALEDQIRRKNQELEDFFENSAVALHIVSSSGIILRANKAELNLLGYTKDEYIGRHVAEFHADAPVIGEILERLSCGEKLDQYPARLRAKGGSIKHVLITSNSRFKDGQFVNTRCFTTDVTGLHEAELARRESEERLAATYEAASVGIAEADETGRLLRVNDALTRILGRSREQLLEMSFLDFTDPRDRDEDAALYGKQVRGELDSYSIRKRSIKADGAIANLDVSSSSVRDSAGSFRYGVRVIQDVTAQKMMEDQLRDRERHMRELLEALPAAVYTTDANGRITFFNKAAIALAGRTPAPHEEWCVSWRLFWPDGTPLPHNECPMALSLRENRSIHGAEALAERPDGTRVPFLAYPTPLHDADGKLVGAVNMLVDITDRKQAETRQKILIDELNHRVKNTLATVQSLALQTARYATSLKDFVGTFETRLLALARAHDLLTKRQWQSAPLEALVQDVVAPYASERSDRMKLEGPSVNLNPRAALSMTMVLSELVTNAGKYGALSTPSGAVSIVWAVPADGGRRCLALEWRERGGPPVLTPTRRGFGTRLMERCIKGDLDGDFDLAFDNTGVNCRFSIPLNGLGE